MRCAGSAVAAQGVRGAAADACGAVVRDPGRPGQRRPGNRAFGLFLVRLDVRQDSSRHSAAMTEITDYLGLGR
ncbi:phosphoenolpyruvate carboxylase, partial [Corynebacterium diphtheriae]